MAEPTTLPTWRYYPDGRGVIVYTLQEYAALPPGHSDNPAGPWPAPSPTVTEAVTEAVTVEPEVEAEEPAVEPAVEVDESTGEGASLQEQARVLRSLGQSVRQISETLQRSPRTVRRWLGE